MGLGSSRMTIRERDEKIRQVLELASTGESFRASCLAVGIPVGTFYKHVNREQYARARDASADVQFDELDTLAADVRDGNIDPQAARVAADITKWTLARKKPKSYGDKLPSGDTLSDQKTGIITALKGIFNAD